MSKAISAVIATVMLLMTTVSLIGVFYVFSSTLATQTTSSGSQQASQLTAQLSMCMQIDNIAGNQIILRNCGKGVIENKSLVVMMDDIVLSANTQTIQEGNSSVVNISGLWQVPFGKHSLKISNGAAVALALVEITPNPDGLAGSWNFDEGSGTKAYDNSGNGNTGTLTGMNNTGNNLNGTAPSGWTAGKYGDGLGFDGANDYVNVGNGASLNITNAITISAWVNPVSLSVTYEIVIKDWDSSNNGYKLEKYGSYLRFRYNNGISYAHNTGTTPLVSNRWNFVSVAFNGTNTTFTVNGISETQASVGSLHSTTAPVYIGTYMLSSNYFNGTIDEVRIWNRALSPDETVTMKQLI
ncbi:MAG: LamG domain-containing protein [Candidatus Aenigmatarchaeota archaeon]